MAHPENGNPPGTEMNESPCRWTRICDVMGNRQALFIKDLRPLKTSQKLTKLSRGIGMGDSTYQETTDASMSLHNLIESINTITTKHVLNVPPDENEMLRQCAIELVALARDIDQDTNAEPQGRQAPSATSGLSEAEKVTTSTQTEAPLEDTAVDKHSLKEFIDQNLKMVKKLQKFVDKRTERRWWLRDVINFAQLIVKLLIFISASIAVFYPSLHVFSIVTLALSIAQAVIEALYQYFFKNKRAKDIKMQVITTKSAANRIREWMNIQPAGYTGIVTHHAI